MVRLDDCCLLLCIGFLFDGWLRRFGLMLWLWLDDLWVWLFVCWVLGLFVLSVDLRVWLRGFVLIRWRFSCCGLIVAGDVRLGFGLILWCCLGLLW